MPSCRKKSWWRKDAVCAVPLAVANVCQFPDYLRRAAPPSPPPTVAGTGGQWTDERSTPGDSQWVTELRYSAATALVQSRLDVVVFDAELMAKVSFAVQCQPGASADAARTCYETELVYRRSCVERFSADKFKVLHNEGLWVVDYRSCFLSTSFVPKHESCQWWWGYIRQI